MNEPPDPREGDDAPPGQLTSEVAAQLAELHTRSTVKKGQGQVTPARRQASTRLWELVNQQYTAGVSSAELGRVLGVQAKTVMAQLRSHGYLGGPSPTRRKVRDAAGPGRHQPPSPRLAAAADDARRASEHLAAAKVEVAAAREELRRAVLAENAASRPGPWRLAVQAGVGVQTILHWLEAHPQPGDDRTGQPDDDSVGDDRGSEDGKK
jgi:hypothetical protein